VAGTSGRDVRRTEKTAPATEAVRVLLMLHVAMNVMFRVGCVPLAACASEI
jgi:hypothetical protein